MVERKGFICKKDGKEMYFVEESEKMSDGSRKAVFYYRCPVCGYRVEAEHVMISFDKGKIVIKRRIRPL